MLYGVAKQMAGRWEGMGCGGLVWGVIGRLCAHTNVELLISYGRKDAMGGE